MKYIGRQDTNRFNGMDVLVLPDDDERMRDIPDGHIGSDGVRFYCRESMWPRIRDQLISLSSNAPVTGRPPAEGGENVRATDSRVL